MKKTKGSNDEFDEAYILVHKGGDSSSFPDGDGHTKTRFWLAGDVPPRNTSSDAFAVTEKRDKNGVHTLQYTVPADRLTQAVFDDLQQLQMSVRSGFQEIYAAIDSHINRHRIVITVNGKQQSSARNAHDNVVEALTRPYSTGQHIAAATSTVVTAVTTTVAALVTKATECSEDVAVATTVSDTDVAAASPEYPAEVVARWALALAHPVAHLVPQDIIQLHAGGLPVTFQTTPQQPVRASPVRVDIRCGSFPAPYLTVQSRQSHYSSKPHSSPPAEGSLRRFAQINVSFEVHVVGPQRVSTAASPAPSSAGPLFETAAVVEFEVLPERTP